MKIISWNVNSVRARINNILDYIKLDDPDILLLQEIKLRKKLFLLKILKMLVIFHMSLDRKVIME